MTKENRKQDRCVVTMKKTEITIDNCKEAWPDDAHYIARVARDGSLNSALTDAGWERETQSYGIYLDGLDSPCVQVSRVSRGPDTTREPGTPDGWS